MRKDDVERSYHQGHSRLPMTNVKVYGSVNQRRIAKVCEDLGYPDAVPFLTDLLDRDEWPEWTWEAACEDGWTNLQDSAEHVFSGYRPKVYQAGRSGGWCVVEGLPNVDEWDAVMLAKWARFVKWARAEADVIPDMMVELAILNVYEAERERREAATRTLLAYA